jgi:probable HAF family extracellular repeat protein
MEIASLYRPIRPLLLLGLCIIGFSATSEAQLRIYGLSELTNDLVNEGLSDHGDSLAISGDFLAVGATTVKVSTSPSANERGKVYLYSRVGTNWNLILTLQGDVSEIEIDNYGVGVALDGDVLVVGDDSEAVNPTEPGAIYIYEKSLSGLWPRVAKFSPQQAGTQSSSLGYGSALALNNGILAVGIPDSNNGFAPDQGGVYIYEKIGLTWQQTAHLTLNDLTGQIAPGPGWMPIENVGGEMLGSSVAINGSSILAGAPGLRGFDSSMVNRAFGGVYYLEKSGTWSAQHLIRLADTDPDRLVSGGFGWSVALEGNDAYIGMEFGNELGGSNVNDNDGAVFTFEYDGSTTWTRTSKIIAVDHIADGDFSRNLEFAGGILAVSSDGDPDTIPGSGALYFFKETTPTTWTLQAKLKDTTPSLDISFGKTFSFSSDAIIALDPSGNNGKGSTQTCAWDELTSPPPPSPPADKYVPVRITTLGGAQSVAWDVNNSLHVAGSAEVTTGPTHAIRYDGVVNDLGVLPGLNVSEAKAINDNGYALGFSGVDFNTSTSAVVWSPMNTATELAQIAGGTGAFGEDINTSGIAVGFARDGFGSASPVMWNTLGAISQLPIVGGGSIGQAYGINDLGDACGNAETPGFDIQPVIWPAGGGMTVLSSEPGGGGVAYDLNTSGSAVGYITRSSSDFTDASILWEGSSRRHLGQIGIGVNSRAHSINESGEVVGYSSIDDFSDNRAFVWDDVRGIRNLNDYLLSGGNDWILREAYGINDAGYIVGIGDYQGGASAGFLLLPEGKDFDGDGVDDVNEATGPNTGDGNSDGVADFYQADVATFANSTDGTSITLAVGAPFTIGNAQAIGNPSPGNAPAGVSFPLGFVSFSVEGLGPGGIVSIDLYHNSGATPSSFWKYGKEPSNTTDHWYEFNFDGLTGAQVIAPGHLRLTFIDGQRGDNDVTADGTITDPGAPSEMISSVTGWSRY